MKNRLERLGHQIFCALAKKHGVDVDRVEKIVAGYAKAISPAIRPLIKLRSKNYPCVIEVHAPVRFYWTEDGFDGIEIGPLGDRCTAYSLKLLSLVLDAVGGEDVELPKQRKRKPPIPKAFWGALDGGA